MTYTPTTFPNNGSPGSDSYFRKFSVVTWTPCSSVTLHSRNSYPWLYLCVEHAFQNQKCCFEYLGEVPQVIHSVTFLFSQTQSHRFRFLIITHGSNVIIMLMVISELCFLNLHKYAFHLSICYPQKLGRNLNPFQRCLICLAADLPLEPKCLGLRFIPNQSWIWRMGRRTDNQHYNGLESAQWQQIYSHLLQTKSWEWLTILI